MKTNCNHKKKNRGFSLVEMLVVIAVIGILAGISIAAMSNTNGTAKTNAAKRNAQTLCSLYSSAQAVGASFSSNTKAGILEEMIEGRNGADLAGSQFKMSPLAAVEKTAALAYCSFDADTQALTYHDDGVLEEAAPIMDEGWSEWQQWTVYPAEGAEAFLAAYRTEYPTYQFASDPIAGDPYQVQLRYRYPLN